MLKSSDPLALNVLGGHLGDCGGDFSEAIFHRALMLRLEIDGMCAEKADFSEAIMLETKIKNNLY